MISSRAILSRRSSLPSTPIITGTSPDHDALAQTLEDSGHLREAERCRELKLWAGPAAEFPDHPELRRRWLDGLNDLAWFLANDCEPEFRDPMCAVELAEEAAVRSPGCATYWNTLGAAYYRAEIGTSRSGPWSSRWDSAPGAPALTISSWPWPTGGEVTGDGHESGSTGPKHG